MKLEEYGSIIFGVVLHEVISRIFFHETGHT